MPITSPRLSALLLTVAGAFGASGVGLSAVAAHASGGEGLDAAALMLLAHAGVFFAAAAYALRDNQAAGLDLRLSLLALGVGVALFSGDLAYRFWGGARLFPMAAPIGGSAMILGWVGIAFCGVLRLVREGTRPQPRSDASLDSPARREGE